MDKREEIRPEVEILARHLTSKAGVPPEEPLYEGSETLAWHAWVDEATEIMEVIKPALSQARSQAYDEAFEIARSYQDHPNELAAFVGVEIAQAIRQHSQKGGEK